MLNKLSPSLVENLGLDLGENLEMRLSQVAGSLGWEQIFILTRRFLEVYNDNKNPLIAQLPLEIVSKGRFDKSEPTIHHGEDLDLPTYLRRGVPLN